MSETSGLVTTIEDARAVIEEIARRKGSFTDSFKREAEEEAKNGRRGMLQAIEGGEEIREDLVKALKIISTDLYTNRARFLMEVIQNADDNKYTAGDMPRVSIAIFPDHVKVECNEEGFSKENVQALCRTGRSSKTPGQGYIGEKGIGFKSVFKLANRAHVRSHPYYFQLDQTRELGMITPQWDKDFFDDYEEDSQTTIVLDHICDKSTNFSSTLETDIKTIDPVLILFLRRIDRLHLTLFNSSSDKEPAVSKRFRRIDWTPDSGIVALEDEDSGISHHFYKHRFAITFTGTETRRPGITKSDIVLAFPVQQESSKYMALILKQNFAFAYLPLGDFGFKFIIQADFLTTSNRQSVDEDNSWNKNIADAIPYVFEAAIQSFNANAGNADITELAKAWPLYLNNKTSGLSAYWRGIITSINEHLSGVCVIKDRTGRFRKPRSLMFLDWAHDRHGKPMFGNMCDYVSPEYPASVREALLLLKVTAPNWKWVCDKLLELHDGGLLHVRMQSKEWCSDLAKIIIEQHERWDNWKHANDLKRIPLIPLTNGSWRCPPSEDDPIYFPASSGATIPPGLPLSLVDEEACSCPRRRKLFRLLGVKDCNIPNIVEQILDYHSKLSMAFPSHLVAQVKYLHKMRGHLRVLDMNKIYFACCASEHLQKGISTYADISVGGELAQLFAGHSKAHFLDSHYFAGLDPSESDEFAKWLSETAGVALAPRITTNPYELHGDFKWLLNNKRDQVLAILHQNWNLYSESMTSEHRRVLAGYRFGCRSGRQVALRDTYISLPMLMEKANELGNADNCEFLVLPTDNPKDWEFLSCLYVGVKEGLDFYLWVLNQVGFKEHGDIEKSKQLYLAIQSRAFSPIEKLKVKAAFVNALVKLPNHKFALLESCVWHGPKGFSSKPALLPVYGYELNHLFRTILEVPNATATEAGVHLLQLRENNSTTMADVAEAYLFLQEHRQNELRINTQSLCIALPSSSGSTLEWKTPAQCVWGDDEFSQNGLELESKSAIRRIVEQHVPRTKAFFTEVIQLPDAGIDELLGDLALMQKNKRDDSKRVYRLYERIESCRRSWPDKIKNAFMKDPLIFIRDINSQHGQWVSLKNCIWTRSVLRHKHALMPSLNQYRGLFRDMLQVPNATMDMLITDLLELHVGAPIEDDDEYQYVKELLQEIARLRRNDKDLQRLDDKPCWPCRTPKGSRMLCSIGNFYINDRQCLFDIFVNTHNFLDFDFDTSRQVADLLRNRGCESFLSEEVLIKTEACEPLEHDRAFTQDFRGRADALVKYFEHVQCESPYEVRLLLENARVWVSADIKTHYKLERTTVTKSGGGSSIEVVTRADETPKLEIYVSANRNERDCALIDSFPRQLVAALELEPADLPDLHSLLQVPLVSLSGLLIRKGITGGDTARDCEDTMGISLVSEAPHGQGGNDDSSDTASTTSSSSVGSDSRGSAVIDSTRASARSRVANTILPIYVEPQTSARPTTPGPQLQDHQNVPSDGSPGERQVTPRPAPAGLYSSYNRNRNRVRLEGFARNADLTQSFRPIRPGGQDGGGGSVFDMSTLRETLQPAPMSTPVQVNPRPHRRAGLIPNRNEEEMARDFEVGFLGEHFVYALLHDTLNLANFTGEDNWTSSLRTRAGFSSFGREVSDFTYKDTQGALTRYFLQMRHSYATPPWLHTACDNGNMPIYRLEVKSTTSQDPTTTFYMSGGQYKLAKKLRVTSATPSEIYVVLRVSGLDALEEGARHQPQYRVYLDPYTRGEEGILTFVAPTYAVTTVA